MIGKESLNDSYARRDRRHGLCDLSGGNREPFRLSGILFHINRRSAGENLQTTGIGQWILALLD